MRYNRYILSIITFAYIIMSMVSCENKWPDNGDLDGMWQLMSIEQNGIVTSQKDTKCYWSIRSDLVQYTTYGNLKKRYSHFERKDGKLILTDFCHESRNATSADNDEWITYDERDILNKWGIYAETDPNHTERLTQTFTIDHLDNDCLILSTSTYKLEFRKF